jgi:Mg2+/citrate symporter
MLNVMMAQVNELVGPLINYGALGICLVALAIYHIAKDKKSEKRIKEMSEMEQAFRKEQADQQEKFRKEQAELIEKYRGTMEKVNTTLETVVIMLKSRGGKP